MLVFDSPNRRVTEAIEWRHPEHTAELAVEEIQALLELAGFEVEELRGVLLGYDSSLRAFLDLEDLRVPWRSGPEVPPPGRRTVSSGGCELAARRERPMRADSTRSRWSSRARSGHAA